RPLAWGSPRHESSCRASRRSRSTPRAGSGTRTRRSRVDPVRLHGSVPERPLERGTLGVLLLAGLVVGEHEREHLVRVVAELVEVGEVPVLLSLGAVQGDLHLTG